MVQAGISVCEVTLPNLGKLQGSTESGDWVAVEPPWGPRNYGYAAVQQWHGARAP